MPSARRHMVKLKPNLKMARDYRRGPIDWPATVEGPLNQELQIQHYHHHSVRAPPSSSRLPHRADAHGPPLARQARGRSGSGCTTRQCVSAARPGLTGSSRMVMTAEAATGSRVDAMAQAQARSRDRHAASVEAVAQAVRTMAAGEGNTGRLVSAPRGVGQDGGLPRVRG